MKGSNLLKSRVKASPATTVSFITKSDSIVTGVVYGGMCNYHLGQYEEAIAHYDIAKAKHEQSHGDGPLLGQILYNRGLAFSSLMRFDQAILD